MSKDVLLPTAGDLAQLPLFGGLSDDARAAFAARAEVRTFSLGDVVFSEGDQARALFLVKAGHGDVEKMRHGRTTIVWRVGPGDCFGEASLIDMQPRASTVRATEPMIVWAWPYSTFHERYCQDMKCFTLVIMNIARELSRRLRQAEEKLTVDGAQEDAPAPSRAPGRSGARKETRKDQSASGSRRS